MPDRQPFFRAKDPEGRWGSFRLEDLDERSFRRLLGQTLCEIGVFAGVAEDTGELRSTVSAERE